MPATSRYREIDNRYVWKRDNTFILDSAQIVACWFEREDRPRRNEALTRGPNRISRLFGQWAKPSDQELLPSANLPERVPRSKGRRRSRKFQRSRHRSRPQTGGASCSKVGLLVVVTATSVSHIFDGEEYERMEPHRNKPA